LNLLGCTFFSYHAPYFDKMCGSHLGFWHGDLLFNSGILHFEGNPYTKFEHSRSHIFHRACVIEVDVACETLRDTPSTTFVAAGIKRILPVHELSNSCTFILVIEPYTINSWNERFGQRINGGTSIKTRFPTENKMSEIPHPQSEWASHSTAFLPEKNGELDPDPLNSVNMNNAIILFDMINREYYHQWQ
jgi:hypothetical protein